VKSNILMNNINRKIALELYRTFVLFGADFDLLSTVGSWGDSLPDEDVLASIKHYNETTLDEIKGRIEHYEITSHRLVCNRVVGKKIIQGVSQ
jgi:hypothetical protein